MKYAELLALYSETLTLKRDFEQTDSNVRITRYNDLRRRASKYVNDQFFRFAVLEHKRWANVAYIYVFISSLFIPLVMLLFALDSLRSINAIRDFDFVLLIWSVALVLQIVSVFVLCIRVIRLTSNDLLTKVVLLERCIMMALLDYPQTLNQNVGFLINSDEKLKHSIFEADGTSRQAQEATSQAPNEVDGSLATKVVLPSNKAIAPVRIRQLITRNFTFNELVVLCFDLEIPYETIKGDSLDITVINLITFCQQRGRLDELLEACRHLRPHLPWPPTSPSP